MHTLRFLKFKNNENPADRTSPDYSRLWKIRNIFNAYSILYYPQKNTKFGYALSNSSTIHFKGYTITWPIYLQKHVNAAADVAPILQTVFLLIRKVDDDRHKMFMKNYFSSFQLFLNQENKELWDCSSWHKRHVNKLLASEKKAILQVTCMETPILSIRR